MYRVVFYQKDLWEGYHGTDDDNLEIEVSLPAACNTVLLSVPAMYACHAATTSRMHIVISRCYAAVSGTVMPDAVYC